MRAGGEVAYVAIGSNLGDRDATLAAAIRSLDTQQDLLLVAASPVFESDPVGPAGQQPYLNAVVELRAWLSPLVLLSRLQAIEVALGRDRSESAVRWGARTLDLDLLFFGDRCIDLPDLTVPHPRAHERGFVMKPMASLAPRFVHPVLGLEVARILVDLIPAQSPAVRPWPRPAGWPGAGAPDGLTDSD